MTRKDKIAQVNTLLRVIEPLSPEHLALFNRYSSQEYNLKNSRDNVVLKFNTKQDFEIYKKELGKLTPLPESLHLIYIHRRNLQHEPDFKIS